MRSHLPFSLADPDGPTLELKARVEDVLASALDILAKRLEPDAPGAVPLVHALRETVLAGGKRLRPILCVWGYRAGGGDDGEAIVRAAAALELVHTFAIVQDDLMDGARVRRGRPALHVRLAEGAGDAAGDAGPGAAVALLVADLAMVAADELLVHSTFAPDRVVEAFGPFTAMRIDAIAGQYLDLLEGGGSGDEAEAARIGALKSGRYTVEGPLQVGAALAGAERPVREALLRYGRAAGRAFQIRDDVLGVFGSAELTGKDAGSDLRHGKPTILIAKALQATSTAERQFLAARLGHADLTDGELEQVRQVILASGALEETLAMIASLLEEARSAVDVLSIPASARAGLRGIADLLELRPV